jgi:hypothetical protein
MAGASTEHLRAHPRVQAAVLVALKPLIHGGEDWVQANGQTVVSNIGKLFELGALEAALAAMSAHAAERAVQAAAWGMLADLVSQSPRATAIRAKFAELGGIARVMGALDAFPRFRKLVKDAVDVLVRLMIGNTARKAQIIALGGMERVLVAMDNHPDDSSGVCYEAVFALQKMSQAGPEAQQRLAALGAAARVRAAMVQMLLARLPYMGRCSWPGSPRSVSRSRRGRPPDRPVPPASRQPALSQRRPCCCSLPKWASPMGAQTRSCSRS